MMRFSMLTLLVTKKLDHYKENMNITVELVDNQEAKDDTLVDILLRLEQKRELKLNHSLVKSLLDRSKFTKRSVH